MRPNAALIMCGGRGKRMRALTDNRPKSMLEVGGVPIIGLIVRHIAAAGISEVYFALHYLPQTIQDYFGDGSEHGIAAHYIHEDKPLGTIGAAALVPAQPFPMVVVNGDTIFRADIGALLDFHRENKCAITIGAGKYRVSVPYGLLETDLIIERQKGRLDVMGIQEKPTFDWYVSAGIYILGANAILKINGAMDMPALVNRVADGGGLVCAYDIGDRWIGINTPEDLEAANATKGR